MGTFSQGLVGAWELVSFHVALPDGSRAHPLGPDAEGYILYTADGFMSADLMQRGRAPYASGDVQRGTPEEMTAAASGYVA